MRTHRIPAGPAAGAMAGMYPDAVSIGLPPLMGWSLWDDFLRLGATGDYGDARLTEFAIGGTAPTVTAQNPTANTETGIVRVETPAGSVAYEGGGIGLPATPQVFTAGLPSALMYCAKVRLVDTSTIEAWSGFADVLARPVSGGVPDFVGFRATPDTLTNWHGVIFDGTTWTEVDLGVAADSTWRLLGFRLLPQGGSTDTAYGLQFYTIEASQDPDMAPAWDEQGDLQVVSRPTGNLTLVALGVVTTSAGTPLRAAEVDFVGVGGRGRRL